MKTLNPMSSGKLLPLDEQSREVSERLYSLVKTLPIISPHGHVDPKLLLENQPFSDPAELLIYHDHYVTRLLHAAGLSLEELGKTKNPDPRKVWRLLCANWHLLAGTASSYWLQHELETLFGISQTPDASNADEIFDVISSQLGEPEFRPRELLKRFNISFLATTDDPCDDLADHRALAEDPTFACRVVPTFRPDRYLNPALPGFGSAVDLLIQTAGETSATFANYLSALRKRRLFFIENGAVSADHGVAEAYTVRLSDAKISQLFDKAYRGTISVEESREFTGHMIYEMAKMSCEDGLVMTLHAGVFRNHSSETFQKFGPDTGHDIPLQAEFVRNLHPLLEDFGLNPNLHLILFALDETVWSREIAPLAGFYPTVYIGAPWWFLDAPDSATRFREATTEIAGFYRGSGFIDDTRAFLSIPARHDMARRVDCAYLARLVAEGRLTVDLAEKIAVDLVTEIPRKAFKL